VNEQGRAPAPRANEDDASRDVAVSLATALMDIAQLAADTAVTRALEALVGAPIEDRQNRLLTLGEAAERLSRSSRWLRQRVRSHEIGVVRLDAGALAFTHADIDDFIARHRVPPAHELRRGAA
jgi:hypothetical protein